LVFSKEARGEGEGEDRLWRHTRGCARWSVQT